MADFLTLPYSPGVLKTRLEALKGFDCTVNVLAAAFLFAYMKWWDFWDACGTFSGDSDHYRSVTREGGDIVKKYQTAIPADQKVVFYENACLFGALLPR